MSLGRLSLERTLRRWIVGCLVAVGVLGLCAPASAQPPQSQPWWLLESDGLVFISQVPETRLLPIALHLQALRRIIGRATTLLPLTPVPVYIFVFRDEGTQLPYRHVYGGEPALLSGAFYPGPHADFLTVSAEQGGVATAAHEVLHTLLYSQLPGAPLWLEEGLAELFGALDLVDAKGDCGLHRVCEPASLRAVLGRPVVSHLGTLQELRSDLDMAGLPMVSSESPEVHEFSGQQTFYARAWAFAHYLALGPESRRRQAWDMVAAGPGVTGREAVAQAFGQTPEQLDVAVRHHFGLTHGGETAIPAPSWQPREFAIDGEPLRLTSRRLAYDELVTLLGELLVVEGRPDDARDHFRLALQVNPQNARAQAGNGFAAERSNDLSRARAVYGEALRAAPGDPLLAFRYAASLLVFGRAADAGKLAEAQKDLTRATALSPRLAPAWAALLDACEISEAEGAALRDRELVFARLRAADPEVSLGLLIHYIRHSRGRSAQELIDHVLVTDGAADLRAAREALERHDWLRRSRTLPTDLIRP